MSEEMDFSKWTLSKYHRYLITELGLDKVPKRIMNSVFTRWYRDNGKNFSPSDDAKTLFPYIIQRLLEDNNQLKLSINVLKCDLNHIKQKNPELFV